MDWKMEKGKKCEPLGLPRKMTSFFRWMVFKLLEVALLDLLH